MSQQKLLTPVESLAVLPQFSAAMLKITLKLGGVQNLLYLPLQYRIHAAVMRLMEERDEVRLVVVKPRQIRSSTYFQSLIIQQMYDFPGTQALTLTHRGSVTDEIFAILKRFQDLMPLDVQIKAKKDNEQVLYLANESKAKVATAGSDEGRGFPCRIFQWSEAGRCTPRQVDDVKEGAFQTLATGLGSAGIIESTSGGEGNFFHNIAKEGLDPNERWKTLFFGWQEEPEYVLPPPPGWEPDEDEKELAAHFNLTLSQLYWRHSKLKSEFEGSTVAFNREYPATFDMAFEAPSGRLIDYLAVLRARKSTLAPSRLFPVIMGVDPAGKGDRTVIVIRQGNVILRHYVYRTMDDATLTGIVNRLMNEWQTASCFIDMGYGHGTVSALRDLGRFNVIGVHFGASASNPNLYRNKRTEMAADFRDWMHQGPNSQGGLVRIPDDAEFCDDLKAIPDLEFSGSKGVFFLPAKDKIKETLKKSTDIFDACCLTFAFAVRTEAQKLAYGSQTQSVPQSSLKTEQAFSQLQGEKQDGTLNPNFRYFSYPDERG